MKNLPSAAEKRAIMDICLMPSQVKLHTQIVYKLFSLYSDLSETNA